MDDTLLRGTHDDRFGLAQRGQRTIEPLAGLSRSDRCGVHNWCVRRRARLRAHLGLNFAHEQS